MNQLHTFNGVRIIENRYMPAERPKIQLSHKVMVSDKFRKETNEWYGKMFGYELIFLMHNGCMITNPVNVIKLKHAIEKNNVTI